MKQDVKLVCSKMVVTKAEVGETTEGRPCRQRVTMTDADGKPWCNIHRADAKKHRERQRAEQDEKSRENSAQFEEEERQRWTTLLYDRSAKIVAELGREGITAMVTYDSEQWPIIVVGAERFPIPHPSENCDCAENLLRGVRIGKRSMETDKGVTCN